AFPATPNPSVEASREAGLGSKRRRAAFRVPDRTVGTPGAARRRRRPRAGVPEAVRRREVRVLAGRGHPFGRRIQLSGCLLTCQVRLPPRARTPRTPAG